MKRFLLTLLLISTAAFAAERAAINPDLNGDYKIKVNVGGTMRDALTVTGSTAASTIGYAGSTAVHNINGARLIVNPTVFSSPAVTVAPGSADVKLIGTTGGGPNWSLYRVASGTPYLAFLDEESSTVPFLIRDAAPTGSLDIQASGIATFGNGIALPTSGGSQANLNYYEEYVATSGLTWNGFAATPSSYTVRITRVGKVVTARIAWALTNKDGTTERVSLNLPARFHAATRTWTTALLSGDGGTIRVVAAGIGGQIEFFANASLSFWGSGSVGIGPPLGEAISLSWIVN